MNRRFRFGNELNKAAKRALTRWASSPSKIFAQYCWYHGRRLCLTSHRLLCTWTTYLWAMIWIRRLKNNKGLAVILTMADKRHFIFKPMSTCEIGFVLKTKYWLHSIEAAKGINDSMIRPGVPTIIWAPCSKEANLLGPHSTTPHRVRNFDIMNSGAPTTNFFRPLAPALKRVGQKALRIEFRKRST